MALKKFEVHYKRYGNCATYNHNATVMAVSPKMAMKKFYNEIVSRGWTAKDITRRKDVIRYEQEALGIRWDVDPNPIELHC